MVGFLLWVFAEQKQNLEIPSLQDYAPNFWFDSEEKYYPVNPLDFYYDENLNELRGEEAVAKHKALSLEEKLKNFKVFYKIDEESGKIIYQYWLFYVDNTGNINSHFGDWEFVFVFIDKDTKKVDRVISSFHQGGAINIELAGSKLANVRHAWIYVGRGSHANCPDFRSDATCDSKRWKIAEFGWRPGVKVLFSDSNYQLLSLDELKNEFSRKYGIGHPLITKEKSPKKGVLPLTIGNKTKYLLPVGGDPPENAWAKKEYHDPYAAVPVTGEVVAEKAKDVVVKIDNAVQGIGEFVGTPWRLAGESLAESAADVDEVFRKLNPFRAGVVGFAAREGEGRSEEDKDNDLSKKENNLNKLTIVQTEKENIESADQENNILVEQPAAKPEAFLLSNESYNINVEKLAEEQEQDKKIQEFEESESSKISKNINVSNQEENNISQEKSPAEQEPPAEIFISTDSSGTASNFLNNGLAPENTGTQPENVSEEKKEELSFPRPQFVEIAWQPPPPPGPPPIPVVTSHVDGAQVNSQEVSLSGTAESGIWVVIDKGFRHIETRVNENGVWITNIALESGANTFAIKARNLGSVESPSLSFSLTYGIPPTAAISIANYKIYNIDFTVQWQGAGQNSLKYVVQRKEGSSGSWQDWLLDTTLTSKQFSAGKDNTTYYFRVKAIDQTTSLSSGWVETQAEVLQMPVVINEIAWMGTGSTPTLTADEWIELRNRSSQSVDLTSWILRAVDGTPYISLSGTIAAGGYFLLERSPDDNAVSDIGADQTFTGALNDAGEALELLSPDNTLIDRVSGWYAGSTANRLTMERVNPAAGGDTAANWAANNGVTKNGLNADGNPINGTPRAQNSVYNPLTSVGTYISDTTVIAVNTIWSQAGSPYLLMSNSNQSPTVAQGVTLTIEPGVTLKSLNKPYTALRIQGTLVAEGTAGNSILFTSKENSPASGDYAQAILFTSTLQNSSLKYVTFEYGGYSGSAMVKVENSQVQIENSTFRKAAGGTGLHLKNSPSQIVNSIFDQTLLGIVVEETANPVIQTSTFTNNGAGVQLLALSRATVTNNTFSANSVPITMRGNSVLAASVNIASNNTSMNGIEVVTKSYEPVTGSTTWKKDLPYILVINSSDPLVIASGATLILEPGVIIKSKAGSFPSPPYTIIRVEGALAAQGTEEEPVIVTSFRDDAKGGDSNSDGSGSVPFAGDWHKILFKAGSSGSLTNTKFLYGGSWGANPLTIEEGASVSQTNIVIE